MLLLLFREAINNNERKRRRKECNKTLVAIDLLLNWYCFTEIDGFSVRVFLETKQI